MTEISRRFKRMRRSLKVIGLVILGFGVITGYGNLRGWFHSTERQEFLRWALESDVGMAIEHPSAQAFIRRFPPPENARPEEITHVTKNVVRMSSGEVLQASFNYMHRDHSRTTDVATLREIQAWVAETTYPWLAWSLTLLGFLVVLGSTVFDRKNSC